MNCELFVGAESLVSLSVHEVVKLCGVGELDLDNPVGESVLVEEFWLVLQSFVDLYDGTADGRYVVACRFEDLVLGKVF